MTEQPAPAPVHLPTAVDLTGVAAYLAASQTESTRRAYAQDVAAWRACAPDTASPHCPPTRWPSPPGWRTWLMRGTRRDTSPGGCPQSTTPTAAPVTLRPATTKGCAAPW